MVIVFWVIFALIVLGIFLTYSKKEALAIFIKEVLTIFVFLPFAVWGIARLTGVSPSSYWDTIYNSAWVYWLLVSVFREGRR